MLNLDDLKKFPQESIRDFADGDLIFMEGDDSREMYVVVEGEVVVTKRTDKIGQKNDQKISSATSPAGEVILAQLKKGDFVGEMSLLESLPRSASARAIGKTRLLTIQPGGFLLKIRRDPTFAFEMLQSLSRRIRLTNDNLLKALNRGETSADSLKAIIHGSEFVSGPDDSPSTRQIEVLRNDNGDSRP